MDCEINVLDKIVTTVYEYDFATIELTTYYAEMVSDSIVLREHQDMKWLSRDELDSVEWAPADIEAIEKIKKDA